ncbi:hypothetical protein [Bradyrhizobium sp. USDA 4473]
MSYFRRVLNSSVNKFLEVPAGLGCRIVALPQVASRLDASYEKTKQQYARHVPAIGGNDQAIVEGLRTSGVFVTSLEQLNLPGTEHFLQQADALERQHLPLRRSFQAGADAIMAHRQIYHWGLHGRLLDIAENYLGVPVGYDGINIFFTLADGRENGVRLWHRDGEDRRMLKIAVYIHDVDEGNGPFQVLRRRIPAYDHLPSGRFPELTQHQLEETLPDFDMARDVVTCTGKRGTVIFSDTASFYHRGMPAIRRDRYAIFLNYIGRVPLRPFRCERSMVSRAQIHQLAKELPARQRDCVLWRNALPLVACILPPAPTYSDL